MPKLTKYQASRLSYSNGKMDINLKMLMHAVILLALYVTSDIQQLQRIMRLTLVKEIIIRSSDVHNIKLQICRASIVDVRLS